MIQLETRIRWTLMWTPQSASTQDLTYIGRNSAQGVGNGLEIGTKGSLYPFVRHLDGERCHRAQVQRGESVEVPVVSTSFVPEPLPAYAMPPIPLYPHIPLPEPTSESLSTQPTLHYPDIPPIVGEGKMSEPDGDTRRITRCTDARARSPSAKSRPAPTHVWGPPPVFTILVQNV